MQIHHIDPVNKGEVVWTVNIQDLAIIGRLFNEGRVDMTKIIAVAGSEIEKPQYCRIIAGMTSGEGVVDGFSGATALENLSTTGRMGYSAMDAFLGFIPGCVGETSTLAILIGAAILLFTGVASWRTMVSVFVGGLAMGYLFQALGVTTYPAWWHLIVGGFAFGAVFMATDPVTSAQTDKGKYIVGLMTGALAVLIRVVNPAYPEGMMLSILFMNALAPLVDYYVVEANISRRKKRVKLAK